MHAYTLTSIASSINTSTNFKKREIKKGRELKHTP